MVGKAFVLIIVYLCTIGLGIIFAAVLLFVSHKTASKLPKGWRKSFSFIQFQRSIFLLLIYLAVNLTCETIAIYLSSKSIYNSYVMSINLTISNLFLFGFLFINTQRLWKRYAYIILYAVLVGYFINGGYYHPKCILSGISALVIDGICFLVSLIYLTDLLLRPDSSHFRFQLKITVSALIFFLLSEIICSFSWYEILYSELVFYIQASNAILFYASILFIFITEIIKLRRL